MESEQHPPCSSQRADCWYQYHHPHSALEAFTWRGMQEKRRADEELDNKIDNFLTVLDRIRRHDASATSPSSPSSPASSGRWSPKSPNTAKSPAASLRAPAGGVARAAAGGAAKDASQTLRQGSAISGSSLLVKAAERAAAAPEVGIHRVVTLETPEMPPLLECIGSTAQEAGLGAAENNPHAAVVICPGLGPQQTVDAKAARRASPTPVDSTELLTGSLQEEQDTVLTALQGEGRVDHFTALKGLGVDDAASGGSCVGVRPRMPLYLPAH